MALVVYDRVQETTATTGTGTITLGGAVAGYQSFAVVGNGNTTYYCIVNSSQWEVGIGTYSTTGPTLARTTVLSNSSGTTSPITLSGASNVFVTYPSEKSISYDANDVATIGSTLSYSDTGIIGSFASTVAGYNQVIIQNKSSATNASANLNISNNASTASSGYVELGINSSTFSGSGSFNIAGSSYLASASTDLTLGTYGAYNIHFVTNSNTTDAMTIFNSGGISLGGYADPGIGTLYANNVYLGFTQITAAAGTTILTNASSAWQQVVGTTTQTIQLPNATTLYKGLAFTITNSSTGTVTIKDNASTTLDTVVAGGSAIMVLTANGTSAGTWVAYSYVPASYDFSATTANFGGATLTNGIWNGTAIGSAYGGTGLTTFSAANNALYSTSSSALTAGTLPVAAGGTGMTTATANGVLYGNGTSAHGVTAAGTTGQVLIATTGSAPSWGSIPTTAAVTSFSAGTTGFTPSSATTGAITLAGTLNVANGGTGLTTLTTGYIPYGNGTGALSSSSVFNYTSSVLYTPGASLSGNLTFTGTGNRILGLFDGATISNRVAFQTSTTNAATLVGFLPNGTASSSSIHLYTSSDPTNASRLAISATTDARINSDITGTGTYLPLTMYTGGSERLRIDTSGNVGIGATSPAYYASYKTLAIQGPSTTYGGVVRTQSSDSSLIGLYYIDSTGLFVKSVTSTPLILGTADTERMRISATGVVTTSSIVGINGSTPATDYALNITGSTGVNGGLVCFNSGATTSTVLYNDSSAGYLISRSATPLVFGTNNAEKMRIDSSGNVGIGTNSPVGKLNVIGGIGVGSALTGDNAYTPASGQVILSGTNQASLSTYSSIGNSTTIGSISYYAAIDQSYYRFLDIAAVGSTGGAEGSIRLLTGAASATERMRITGAGNVGINTTSPAATLQVNAPNTTAPSLTYGATSGQILRNENSELAIGLSSTSPYPLYMQGRNNGNAQRDISLQPVGGNVGIGTQSPAAKFTVSTGGAATLTRLTDGVQQSLDIASDAGVGSAGIISYNTVNGGNQTFKTGGTERMRILASGGVAIGSTTDQGAGALSVANGIYAESTGPFHLNAITVSSNFTIPTNYNAMSAGPITINTGITVTVSTGSNWVIN
jgi:hypothetical protein